MAAPMSASKLVWVLRAEGCRVVEYRDWRDHNRNHRGAWGPINGVMVHHTVTRGTDGSVRLCYEGHAGLPGPLCHGVIAKDGTIYLVGNGRANHAGLGDDDVMRDVVAERELSPDNEANTDGNARYYGFEAINMGDGEDPWPDAQLEAIERASAAICRHYEWDAESVIGHLEWQPGKVDPRGFGMDWMRRRVQARLDGPPSNQHDHDQEDDVSPEDIKRIAELAAKETWGYLLKSPTAELGTDPHRSAGAFLRWDDARHAEVMAELAATRAVVDKLADAVGAVGDFDPADLKHAIRQAVTEAVESVRATVTVDVTEGN